MSAQISAEQGEGGTVEYYLHLAELVLDYLDGNKALVESAVSSNSFPLILSVLSEQLILDIRDKLREDARRGEQLPASPEVMAAFFVGGVMETAQSWLKRGRQLGEEELKEQLGALLNHFYMSASAR